MGVVLGIYLFRVGLNSFTIGLVIAAGLAGSALATILVGFAADHLGRRHSVLVLSLLSAVGGLVLAFSPTLPVLLIMAFLGMLNGTGTDRSAAFVLDQAIVPPDAKRTWNLAWYNVLLDGGGSLGVLGAGLPIILQHRFASSISGSYRIVFLGYCGLCLIVAAIYLFLSPAVEITVPRALAKTSARIAPETRKIITGLTALFSLDAFGGGFLTDALVAYWFFRRFGIAEQDLGL
jgi:MFS family permease